MRTRLKTIIPAIAAATVLTANIAEAGYYDSSPGEKLEWLMSPHLFRGQRFTDDIRAATGDPGIPVIDRRKYGDISSCTYVFQRGRFQGRAILCE